MKTIIYLLTIMLMLVVKSSLANNLTIANVRLTNQNPESDQTKIKFDISWENSWRVSSGPSNWDAAWVFVKYSTDGIIWNHAKLNNTGHISPVGSVIQVGLVDENSSFDNEMNPAVGAFIYRDAPGSGQFSLIDVELNWNYGANTVADDAVVDIRVFAVEMVYVPQVSFYIGSGGTESGSFTDGSWTSGATIPLQITSEAALSIAQTAGSLWGTSNSGNNTIGGVGTLPAAYPKGFAGFYMMKYEVTQLEYVNFLNTLTSQEATSLYPGISNRQTIRKNLVSGLYETTYPYVPENQVSWRHAASYMDWSGLRPFTELEYEKACRGDQSPVANEFAWGSSLIEDASSYAIINSGASNENISNNYNSTGTKGNALYNVTLGSINGPLRVGIFASNSFNNGRISSGASYYGILELSGNLYEMVVTIGIAEGRVFTGLHGDGTLYSNSYNVANWPTLTKGGGLRGGAWSRSQSSLCVSSRETAVFTSIGGALGGFRCARSLPSTPIN